MDLDGTRYDGSAVTRATFKAKLEDVGEGFRVPASFLMLKKEELVLSADEILAVTRERDGLKGDIGPAGASPSAAIKGVN